MAGHHQLGETERKLKATIFSPIMQQPPGTLLQPVVDVVVGGTIVGGAPPTRGNGKKTKGQRGKIKVGTVHCRHCKYCTQYGKSLEEASNYPGKGRWSICMGREGGLSLECMICNSTTKCRCPMSKPKAMPGVTNQLVYVSPFFPLSFS
jgi:hypothetical protein